MLCVFSSCQIGWNALLPGGTYGPVHPAHPRAGPEWHRYSVRIEDQTGHVLGSPSIWCVVWRRQAENSGRDIVSLAPRGGPPGPDIRKIFNPKHNKSLTIISAAAWWFGGRIPRLPDCQSQTICSYNGPLGQYPAPRPLCPWPPEGIAPSWPKTQLHIDHRQSPVRSTLRTERNSRRRFGRLWAAERRRSGRPRL